MYVKVDLFDEFEGEYYTWSFQKNKDGFIDIIINNKVCDTLYDLGLMKNIPHLIRTVKYLVNCWKVPSKNFELVK